MNNKGFTTVEVLVCFAIVSVVAMSLFSTISAFNEKKIQESYRARVYEFKNSITNVIQEDIVKRGLSYAKVSENGNTPGSYDGKKVTVDLTFRDGVQKQLVVVQRFTKTPYRLEGNQEENDMFYIEYGIPEGNTAGLTPEMMRYELPNLGEQNGYYDESANTYVSYHNNYCYGFPGKNGSYQYKECPIYKEFQINNIDISISNEADPEVESHVLSIYVGFYHPNLGTKYAINIVAPIDYQSSSVDQQGKFPTDLTNRNSTTGIYYP